MEVIIGIVIFVLLVVALVQRIREYKHDKYKDVEK
tara:strand:+ start:1137 stop:1241 length:105 start_codon:yes stop_codon:yes gene_type:complete